MTEAGETDEALMGRYARGDASAFEMLYRRHELRVWRYLQRSVRNRAAADELMQEVWFAVAREALRYEPTARFTTWLFTIAHHRLIDAFRASRPHVSLDAVGYEAEVVVRQLTAPPAAGPLAAAVVEEQSAAILRAVDQLPAEQRAAFLLQMEGELEVKDIAAITGSSFETVKSRLRYARAKLRELLKEHA